MFAVAGLALYVLIKCILCQANVSYTVSRSTQEDLFKYFFHEPVGQSSWNLDRVLDKLSSTHVYAWIKRQTRPIHCSDHFLFSECMFSLYFCSAGRLVCIFSHEPDAQSSWNLARLLNTLSSTHVYTWMERQTCPTHCSDPFLFSECMFSLYFSSTGRLVCIFSHEPTIKSS
jgi:hypothetical protein